jgi:PAS domain S-box-containing protein
LVAQAVKIHGVFALGVLALLGALSYFSYVSLDALIAVRQGSGAQINVGGRQRMLSQRISLLAARLAVTGDPAEYRSTRSNLLNAVALMAHSHDRLIKGDAAMGLPGNPSPTVQAMYFGPRRYVDRDVRAFLQRASGLVEKLDEKSEMAGAILSEIQEAALGPLLEDLEAVAGQYEIEGAATSASLRLRTVFGTVFGLILLTIFFLVVSRPLLQLTRGRAQGAETLGSRRRIAVLLLIMTAVVVITAGAAIGVLYNTAFEEKRRALAQVAQSQARLMEAVARFDQQFSRSDHPEGAAAATISQIKDAQGLYGSLDETGEFTLARREEDMIVFVLRHQQHNLGTPKSIPFNTNLAEPMRRALSGESGTVIGVDYRGQRVLAAYEPVAVLNMGIVAKVDFAEVRAPFVKAGGIVAAVAVVLVGVGTALFFSVSSPLIRRIEESEERFRGLIEGSIQGVLIHRDFKPLFVNRTCADMFGYASPGEVLELDSMLALIVPPERGRVAQDMAARLRGEEVPVSIEVQGLRKDGTSIWLEILARVVNWLEETAIQVTTVDITGRKGAERALTESQERLQMAFKASNAGAWSWDKRTNKAVWSDEIFRLLGYEPGEVDARNEAWFSRIHPDDKAFVQEQFDRAMAARSSLDFEYRAVLPDDSVRSIQAVGSVIEDQEGNPKGMSGIQIDITGRKRAEQARREAEMKYQEIFENAAEGIFQSTPDGRFLSANPAMSRMLGYDSPEALIDTVSDIARQVYLDPTERERLVAEAVKSESLRGYESQWQSRDGTVIWVSQTVTAVRDEDGRVLYFAGTVEDITERKNIEETLRRSQRMEELGQLTGGIAHDFNNVLSIILGNLEMLKGMVRGDPLLNKRVETAFKGAKRGADLTKRLLGFSRRVSHAAELVSVNEAIAGINELLAKTLTAAITIETHLAEDIWLTMIDRGDFEDAMVNIALNARDAMPDGGKLVIKTANVTLDERYAKVNPAAKAGGYVLVSITDTGTGMSPEIIDRAFEPFYTTKEPGKGTGLGLSMVYGFATRSKGLVHVNSKLGHGTNVRLCLPRATREPRRVDAILDSGRVPRGNETVLVVDDEKDVLDVTVEHLTDLGYSTIAAENAGSALKILAGRRKIDLLFSDVVMPGGMSGYDLAREAVKKRPKVKVLLTSGATTRIGGSATRDDQDAGKLAAGLLAKPYLKPDLARRVRQALDAEE